MKKALIIFTLILLANTISSQAPSNQNPFESFMGVKWGTEKEIFLETFKYRRHLKGNEYFIMLMDFKIGDVPTEKISFVFDVKKGKRPFDSVYITFPRKYYEKFLEILLDKFGVPTHSFHPNNSKNLKKTYKWLNSKSNRMIVLQAINWERLDEVSIVAFQPIPVDKKRISVDEL